MMSEEEMANISSSPDDTMPRESDVSTNPECLRLWKPAVQRKPEKLNCNTETSPPHNNPSMSELHDDADHHLSKITELCAHTLFKNEMEGDSASSDSSSWREIGDESSEHSECLIVSEEADYINKHENPDFFPTHKWEDIFSSSDETSRTHTEIPMLRSLIRVTRATNSTNVSEDEITARSDDKGHSTCWDHPLGSLGALNQHCRVPVSLQFFRASPLPHSCVSPLPHHRAAAPFHARADDDDDANDDDDYSVCPDVETECHSCPKHFQTSTSGMFYGRRRWDFPKQNGNTIWAPRVANKSHVRPAVEGRHWDSPNHAEGSIWAPRDDDESHVGPAVKGRHWDSTKTAVGSCSRKGN